jgi:hypothetical protein
LIAQSTGMPIKHVIELARIEFAKNTDATHMPQQNPVWITFLTFTIVRSRYSARIETKQYTN